MEDLAGARSGVGKTTRVSVCMATWNGERYLGAQLDSVLAQLGPADELIVVDDASSDSTPQILIERADQEPRMSVFLETRNHGSVQTFGLSLERANGGILLLSDQDDIWLPGRVDAMLAAFSEHRGVEVVATNLTTLGGPERIVGPYPWQSDWKLRVGDSRRRSRNLAALLAGAAPYFGCAMAIRRSALRTVLPFPWWLDESHDQWIALYGILTGSLVHLEVRTIARRLHERNLSTPKPRGLGKVAHSRWLLVRGAAELRRRLGTSGH